MDSDFLGTLVEAAVQTNEAIAAYDDQKVTHQTITSSTNSEAIEVIQEVPQPMPQLQAAASAD